MPLRSLLRAAAAACILIYALPGTASAADQAEDLFNSIYGDAYRSALATRSPDDDVALAGQLVSAAKSSASDHPQLLKLLCEKAVELGRKDPSGYPAAISALNLLIEKFPADAALYQPQVIDLNQAMFIRARGEEKTQIGRSLLALLVGQAERERQNKQFNEAEKTYRRALAVSGGVDIDARKSVLAAMHEMSAEKDLYDDIDKAKAVLKLNPDDANALKTLLMAYLVELDDPKEAAQYADADPKAKTLLPLMTDGVEVLSDMAWLDLADWQSSLADSARSDASKARMLKRSLDSYNRFIDRHADKDLARTKAELASQKIQNTLTAMGVGIAATAPAPAASAVPPAAPASNALADALPSHATSSPNLAVAPPAPIGGGRTIDLLKTVDLAKTVAGRWVMQGEALVSVGGGQYSRITLPVEPQGDYELTVEMERAKGDDAGIIVIPVGGAYQAISLGWKQGGKNSLEFIGGPKKVLFSQQHNLVQTGKRFTAVVRVAGRGDQAAIAISIDGQPIIEWQGGDNELYTHEKWALSDPKAVGLGAQTSTWGVFKVELKMLSGSAKFIK